MADAVQAILGNPPPVSNPLAIISGWQDYANKLAQNKLIQQTTANAQLSNQTGQQELATQMTNRHAQVVYGLSNLSDAQLQGGVPLYSALDDELKTGQIDQQRYNVLKGQVDRVTQSGGGTGESYRPLINGLLATTMAGPQAAQFLQGTPVRVDSGPYVQGGVEGGIGSASPGALNMTGAQVPVGGPTNSQLATARIPGPPDDQGRPTSIPLPVQPQYLRPGVPGGPLAPFPGGVRPPPGAGGTPGTQPAQAAPGGIPGVNPATGQVVTDLSPGQAGSMQAQKQASTAQGIALTDTDATRPQRMALLQDILTQANVPGAFTGPDAPGYKSVMARLGQVPGVVNKEVADATTAQDAMEKAMANYQTLAMRGMIGTNAGLAQTIAGAPHMELSRGGLKANVHQLQGTTDAEAVMSSEWQKAQAAGAPPEGFKDWQSKFIVPSKTGQFDPRVFWLKRMSPAERQTFVAAANDPNLRLNYQFAVDHGWIK